MTRGLLTRSIYSPGNLTPEALEALFVGRDKMLDDVLKRLSSSLIGEEKHFILLVGPRGIGKTHFVALAHHRLTHDERYREAHDRAVIAYLSEEEWGVASFLDLLLRILSAIGERHEGRLAQAALDAIYETYQRDPQAAEQLAREELIRVVGDRTLLLICENLHDLFHGLGTEGQQRWRAFIQEHPFWTILATAPRLFSGVQLRTSPFYGFFTIRNLETLDFEGALSLLRQRARFEGKKELAEFLDTPTGRARVRAIHHLAGGNHRIYVVMAEFLDHESLNELLDPFMGMIDDLTPYYQEKMRWISPQQRKVIEYLARMQRPVMIKQIAFQCLMSPQTAAKQIGLLVDYGFVERHRVGRETYCELAEPLMRICIEIKDTRTKHLRLFVDFLRHWFSSREIENRLSALALEQPGAHLLDLIHLRAALHEGAIDSREPFLDALSEEEQRCLKALDWEGLAEASARLAAERGSVEHYFLLAGSLRRLGRYQEALHAALEGGAEDNYVFLLELFLIYAKLGDYQKSLDAARRALLQGREIPNVFNPRLVLHYMRELHGYCFEAGVKFPEILVRDIVSLVKPLLVKGKDAISEMADGVWLLMALEEWKAAHALNTHALSLEPANNRLRMYQYHISLLMGEFDYAFDYADDGLEVNGDWNLSEHDAEAFLQVISSTGVHGLSEGVKHLREWVERFDTIQKETEVLVYLMLCIEVHIRGAVAMARQVGDLRGLLEEHAMAGTLASALTIFIEFHQKRCKFGNSEWLSALPILEDALGDMDECKLPLKVLSVAVRHAASGDETVLLELPRELRSLITQDAHHAAPH